MLSVFVYGTAYSGVLTKPHLERVLAHFRRSKKSNLWCLAQTDGDLLHGLLAIHIPDLMLNVKLYSLLWLFTPLGNWTDHDLLNTMVGQP